jgi:acyl-CoA hydrolase
MSLLQPKTAKESLTILTDLVLPGETNPLNSLFGGELLARMDRACSIAARRHSRSIVVTVSVNHVTFEKAVLWEVLLLWKLRFRELSVPPWR